MAAVDHALTTVKRQLMPWWWFANILRNSATDNVFIGGYGGDEFIAVLHDTNEDEVKAIIGNVKANT